MHVLVRSGQTWLFIFLGLGAAKQDVGGAVWNVVLIRGELLHVTVAVAADHASVTLSSLFLLQELAV